MNFEFATATRILFGPGTSQQLPQIAAAFGQNIFVVTGADRSRQAALWSALEQKGLNLTFFTVRGEPTTFDIVTGLEWARQAGCEVVVGIGGGSVLDAGKAIAALLTNGGQPLDYLEVIGRGQPLTRPSAPYIAVPTTAGTGAEVTRNAVLASPEHRVKVSLRSPLMLPAVAVVDPDLTRAMSPALTAYAGLDALTQLIEPFVSNKANPLTDALCREGIPRAAWALRRAYRDGSNAAAREAMSLASLLGGLALANAGLGAVHGFAGPIGGLFPAPHGAICARLLPLVMANNVHALQERDPDHTALPRYQEVARLLTGQAAATIADGVAWVESLCADLKIPSLATWGVTEADCSTLIAQAQKASSMKANPIRLTETELGDMLLQAL